MLPPGLESLTIPAAPVLSLRRARPAKRRIEDKSIPRWRDTRNEVLSVHCPCCAYRIVPLRTAYRMRSGTLCKPSFRLALLPPQSCRARAPEANADQPHYRVVIRQHDAYFVHEKLLAPRPSWTPSGPVDAGLMLVGQSIRHLFGRDADAHPASPSAAERPRSKEKRRPWPSVPRASNGISG